MADRRGRLRLATDMRLRRPREFQRVFRTGARVGNGAFAVLAVANGGVRARLGLAIARKHLKRAIARNRVKRLVRESFRHNQDLLEGLDVVVLTRPGIGRAETETLRRALEGHWRVVGERARRRGAAEPG